MSTATIQMTGSEPDGVAGAGTPADAGSSQAAGPVSGRDPQPQARRSLTTPLRNTAAVANGGRVETHEGLAALRSNGTITDEEFAAEKTHVMNSST